MEILIVLIILGVPLVWLITKVTRTTDDVQQLRRDMAALHAELRRSQQDSAQPSAAGQSPPNAAPPTTALPPVLPPVIAMVGERSAVPSAPALASVPTPSERTPIVPAADAPPRAWPEKPVTLPSGNWEQFMGVKLFAWIGGLALFLGLAFFVKYSVENNLVTPEMRVTIGYVLGAGLLAGGLVMTRRNYAVLGQTLCATGVLILYANIFAAHAFYHFLGGGPAFALMVLVTAVAFGLAVRLDAQVVGVLGLLGGFLTPVLLATGEDNPLGLFGYLALLDAGLIAVVARKRWNYLVLLAALGTVAMQVAWTAEFFVVAKVPIAIGVLLGFEALFLAAFALTERADPLINAASIGLTFVPLAFALYLLTFPELGAKPWIIFSFVLAAELGALVLVLLRQQLGKMYFGAGTAAFVVLAGWTGEYLSEATLNWALGFYLVFAVLHAVFPVVLARRRPGTLPAWAGHIFPVVMLLLVLVPVVRLPELSWLIWLCVLALDVVVFGIALATASVLAIIGALVLTLGAAAIWIFKVPTTVMCVPELLVVIGGFALVFFAIGVIIARKGILPLTAITGRLTGNTPPVGVPDVRTQIPALSAILPFLLLIMVVLRLPLVNPSPVFGLALLLVMLLLGVARWTQTDWLAAVGLACTAALEYAWHEARFDPSHAVVPLAWYLAFGTVFTVFPFLFRKNMAARVVPWGVAALAGPVQFTLVYRLVKATWPNAMMGLLPAVFALSPLAGLLVLARSQSPKRLAQLAWFGGATLFFVTLIFPIQFERQWITLGWALEGVALLWLFQRVPHNGLRWVGVGLLCAAFARLALNPAVLAYHARSAPPIWNWYLYAYGITTLCLFAAARLVNSGPPAAAAETAAVGPSPGGRALPATLGTVLAFLLVNIEIADYFTAPGTNALTFQFEGNFTRDMTYSIAWALFALGLLVAGIANKLRAVRYASLALLAVTLLKLFLHDLSQLGQLQRIGAFVGVAVILLVSSFLYQRFVAPAEAQQP